MMFNCEKPIILASVLIWLFSAHPVFGDQPEYILDDKTAPETLEEKNSH